MSLKRKMQETDLKSEPRQPTKIIISFDIEAIDRFQSDQNKCNAMGFVAMMYPEEDDDLLDPETQRRLEIDSLAIYPATEGPGDPDTMAWWHHPDRLPLFQQFEKLKKPVHEEMLRFRKWYFGLLDKYDKVTFVANPGPYDWQWLNSLWHRFYESVEMINGKEYKFPYKCECASSIENLTGSYFDGFEAKLLEQHSVVHDPVEDARRQGISFLHIRRKVMQLLERAMDMEELEDSSK